MHKPSLAAVGGSGCNRYVKNMHNVLALDVAVSRLSLPFDRNRFMNQRLDDSSVVEGSRMWLCRYPLALARTNTGCAAPSYANQFAMLASNDGWTLPAHRIVFDLSNDPTRPDINLPNRFFQTPLLCFTQSSQISCLTRASRTQNPEAAKTTPTGSPTSAIH